MKEFPKLLIADKSGNIQYLPELQATGMKGGIFFPMEPEDLVPLHPDSELFMMPGRMPVGFNRKNNMFIPVKDGVFGKSAKTCCAVSAFLAPGYTALYSASYTENKKKLSLLPLFSYSAVAYYKGGFYASGIRVDREKRQELRGMDHAAIKRNIREVSRLFPRNRLVEHLKICALCYGCPAAKNFFLKRYEGPLPTSPKCNAVCIGCISYQSGKKCPVTQPRIKFVPSPEEIAEMAVFHIRNAKDPVVSFRQGCEGEPLLVADTIINAVRIIRKKTSKGVINLNTNASRPRDISRLFDAGLDSVRVSMNSFQKSFYQKYYRPVDYVFGDVVSSIRSAKKKNGFVSVNYLVMPGFTDSKHEFTALSRNLDKGNIDMIQWRNLNYDPMEYFRKICFDPEGDDLMGVENVIVSVKKKYPHIMHGYFNPSKGRIRRVHNRKRIDSEQ